MTNKRRGGEKSGPYPRLGTTPGGGIPAPSMNDVLAVMAAQLEAFSQEVRELKGLIKDLRTPSVDARPVGWETTESLDVESFRRARRQRALLFTGAFMVPLMLLAVWGMWPAATRHQALAPVPAHVLNQPKMALPTPTPVPQPPALVPITAPQPEPAGPLPATVRTTAPIAAPKHGPVAAPSPRQFDEAAEAVRPSRATARLSDQEHSGGAPILD